MGTAINNGNRAPLNSAFGSWRAPRNPAYLKAGASVVVNAVPLIEIAPSEQARLLGGATEIFFETASIRALDSPPARDAFYERWFGHYLETQAEDFFLTPGVDGAAIGYLAGCHNSFSEAARVITGDISYYTPAFCAALRDYPSHFHVNVKPGHQGGGVGRHLVARFVQRCRQFGSPGIHVVTGAQSRAINFYEACGFQRIAPANADPDLAVLVYATPCRESAATAGQ